MSRISTGGEPIPLDHLAHYFDTIARPFIPMSNDEYESEDEISLDVIFSIELFLGFSFSPFCLSFSKYVTLQKEFARRHPRCGCLTV